MNVLVINQWATNKGDRAVLYFVLRELVRNGVEHITVSTSDPAYWRERPDFPDGVVPRCIPSGWDVSSRKSLGALGKVYRSARVRLERRVHFPLVRAALIRGRRPWYLPLVCNRRYLRAVEQADLVLSTGGHRVTTINQPDAVGPQIFDLAVAVLCGKPLVLWSQSIGPFSFRVPENRLMIRAILAGASRILIRNEGSRSEIQGMGVSLDRVAMTHESVFGLYDVVGERTRPTQRPPVMGVSIYATNRRTPESYQEYVQCLVVLVRHAMKSGYEKVCFFPMELEGTDRPCIEAVIRGAGADGRCEIVEGFPGTAEHLNAIARCRLFVGHKTHSVIFSLVAGTPLLAIAYHKKTEDFMGQFGLQEHCVPDSRLTAAVLVEMFDRVNRDLDSVGARQAEMASGMCKQVRRDFADMIAAARSGWAAPAPPA